MKLIIQTFFVLILSSSLLLGQIGFEIPSKVCVGEDIVIRNVSNAINYHWSFCSSELGSSIEGTNLDKQGYLDMPVFSKIVKDQDGFYLFVVNHSGSLTRNYYGNSFLNTPESEHLGSLGVIPNAAEGIEIINENGKWYGFITGGGETDPKLIKLEFGNSLSNIPKGIDFGNIGDLRFPVDLNIVKDDNGYYGFTVNFTSGTITRFEFGTSVTNKPKAINIGNIGQLTFPVGLSLIKEGKEWFMFVTNERQNFSISKIRFGTSLSNMPTGENLGGFGVLNGPRDILFYKDCDKHYAIIVNENTNDLIQLSFDNGINSKFKVSSLGNIGNFSFPHGISEMFRAGNGIYSFITNVNNNSLSLIEIKGCNNSSILHSSDQFPPAFSYNSPGKYLIKFITVY